MKKRVFRFIIIIILMTISNYTIVKAKSNYLYDVLKDEAESGGLAKEYTGEHHDSFTEEPSKKVYHWYAANDTQGNQVLEKNNVIFANHCWQMIRTTDTGGVKMIYNGEVEDGKCLNTRGNHVGYSDSSIQNLNSNYYYGTSYTYDSTEKLFKLSGSLQRVVWNASIGQNLIGKYTCKSDNIKEGCSTLYLIEAINDDISAYAIQLNSNSNYSQLGIIQFNANHGPQDSTHLTSSPSYAGYMYNTVYSYQKKDMSLKENMLYKSSLGINYWYADSITWGTPVTNKYNLDNPYKVSTIEDYPNLTGKYTFKNTSETYTSSNVQYIAATNYSLYYYIQLQSGHNLDYYNYAYTFGDSYIDNGDGTYTITNPVTILRKDWFSFYKTMNNKYVCKNAINNTCNKVWYTTATSPTDFTYTSMDMLYKYGNGFTYKNGKYILNDNSITFWNIGEINNRNSIDNYHYTCWNASGECTNISYIYYIYEPLQYDNEGITPYYIDLKNGVDIDSALQKMLKADDVNKNNSTIKIAIDAWYEKNMLDYSEYLEDTIFCNDRSIKNLNGWDPNGGSITEFLQFNENEVTNNLNCKNVTDKFSVNNDKANLKYKVGLASSPEMNILNNLNIRKTENSYWLASPSTFYNDLYERYVYNDGGMSYSVPVSYGGGVGVRPSISLKSTARVIEGDGSTLSPYQLSFEPLYSINVEIVNETEDLTVEINDLTQVEYEEEVTFRVTPIKGYKVDNIKIIDKDNNKIEYSKIENKNEYSFIMPASNVTIIPSYKRVSNSVNVDDNKNTKEFIIEVNDSKAVVYEDTVKFTIIPEDGYELEDIEIIDKNNNKIEYKKTSKDNEYIFTMPDSDVIIKPIYIKIPIKENNNLINPLTNNKFIIISLLILLFFSIGNFLYRKQV